MTHLSTGACGHGQLHEPRHHTHHSQAHYPHRAPLQGAQKDRYRALHVLQRRYVAFDDMLLSVLIVIHRRHQLLQAHPAAHKIWPHRSHQGVAWYARVLQGTFRRAHQPDGHGLHVALQARVPEVERALERVHQYYFCRCNGGMILVTVSTTGVLSWMYSG